MPAVIAYAVSPLRRLVAYVTFTLVCALVPEPFHPAPVTAAGENW